MRKILLPIIFSLGAFAQSTGVIESAQGVYEQLKQSPLSLSIEDYFQTTRDNEKSINGINNIHEFYWNYKLTDNDSVRLYHRFDTYYLDDEREDNLTVDSFELRYKRANLLTEAENGINLNMQLRYLYLNNKDRYHALYNIRAEATKNLTSKLSMLALLRYDFYQKVPGYIKEGTKNNRLRIYLQPEYAFTDNFKFNSLFLYGHNYFETGDKTNDLNVIPEFTYTFNSFITAGLYMDFIASRSNDSKTFVSQILKDSDTAYGLRLSMSVL